MWVRIYHVHLLFPDQTKEEKDVGSTWGQIFDDLLVKVFYLRSEALDNSWHCFVIWFYLL